MAKKIVSPKNGFTTTFLNKLKSQDKQFELVDHASKGLRLRVSPSGTKTFIWRYITQERKSKVYTIGYYIDKYDSDQQSKNITLSDAREKLLSLKAIHKSGNLLTAKEQKKINNEKIEAENKLKITLAERIEDFYKVLEATRRRPEAARQLIDAEILGKRKGGFEGIILGDLVLREITSQDVQELIYNTIRRGAPEHAMKLLALLKQFFSWCENGNHISGMSIHTPTIACINVNTPSHNPHILNQYNEVKSLFLTYKG